MSRFDPIAAINKYGLRPSSRRELGLFTMSCVGLGYCEYLRESVGFTYNAYGVMGEGKKFVSFVNENDIADKTKILLKSEEAFLKAVSQSKELFSRCERELKGAEGLINKEPYKFLEVIVRIYPAYFSALGFYNCLWRVSKTPEAGEYFSNGQLRQIGEDRNLIGSLYPTIEDKLGLVFTQLEKSLGIDKKFMYFLTHAEMADLVKKQILQPTLKKNLKTREKNYFLLRLQRIPRRGNPKRQLAAGIGRGKTLFYEPGIHKERIFCGKEILKKIKDTFLDVSFREVSEIRGQVAYSGFVKGVVNNVDVFAVPKRLKDGILVAAHTHPKFVSIIKESAAIVCDEGGLLCHAAIIAREMKKPCIIGTKIATKVLKDGDLVEVDAERGVVTIIGKKK